VDRRIWWVAEVVLVGGGDDEQLMDGAPKRRKRFAFSRGPASFLSIELRRLWPCLGNCSIARSVLTVVEAMDRRRSDLEVNRPESDGKISRFPDLDRSCSRGER
jgi:hypothetical protein